MLNYFGNTAIAYHLSRGVRELFYRWEIAISAKTSIKGNDRFITLLHTKCSLNSNNR